jgi:hypothetical protein
MIKVRLKREQLILGDWEPTNIISSPCNWIRRLDPYDGFSCVGWMVSYCNEVGSSFHWTPMFHGKVLHDLCDIYFQFYPSPKPYIEIGSMKYYSCLSPTLLSFRDYQLQEAKDHLDNFINRVNLLKVFL